MTEQDLAKIEAENEKLKSLCNAKPWYYPVASGLRSATATIDQLVVELRRVQEEVSKVRAIKNQLQQELAARPER